MNYENKKNIQRRRNFGGGGGGGGGFAVPFAL